MKSLLVFLFVFSIYMLGYVSGRAEVRITNELKFQKRLWMKCYSKDNVIGPTIIPIGQYSKICFLANLWGTSRYMCTLKQGPNYKHYQNFTAFKQFYWFDYGGTWYWGAREDGIYLKREGGEKPIDLYKAYDWIN
ncbi:hypothetical protein CARUB_v10016516mg [Capsella rubella]|uniref:S-protein homolog n=1 Tax=Capsella rubella TaxID=81985 RepID=R0ETK2_9BRAS|nr:S-protein homolog 31 [Capsella rubella]EOA12096.1 hypothetical protein CARUB_v10016516mg [Capsella rubella]